MGEAKRRKDEIERLKAQENAWFLSLNNQEREIFKIASALDEKLVRGKNFTEGCYHLTFFMAKYLEEKNILVEPVIGWVNDQTWDGVSSHAWIEYLGKKTDVSLGCTSYSDVQPTGSLIILDKTIRKGTTEYLYFKNDDSTALARLQRLRIDPDFKQALDEKDKQHKYMLSIAESRAFEDYLFNAPVGLHYNDIRRLIE